MSAAVHGGARRAPCAIDGGAHCYPADMARKAKSAIGDKPRRTKIPANSESKGASRLRTACRLKRVIRAMRGR